MARYREERRARLETKRARRKRAKVYRKMIRRESGALPKRHTLLVRLVAWLLGGD